MPWPCRSVRTAMLLSSASPAVRCRRAAGGPRPARRRGRRAPDRGTGRSQQLGLRSPRRARTTTAARRARRCTPRQRVGDHGWIPPTGASVPGAAARGERITRRKPGGRPRPRGPTMDRPLSPKRGSCVSATTVARPTPTVTPTTAASGRRRAALLLALRLYLRELRSHPLLATGALLCPALGNVCLGYLPPLVVAALVGELADGHLVDGAAGHPAPVRVRGRPARRGGVLAAGHPLPQPHRRVRHRAALDQRHGRAAGQGRGVLPRELRGLADQAGAHLRVGVRGLRRHAGVPDRREPRAAGVRVGGALAVRPAAGRGAARDHRAHRRRRHAAHPAQAGAGGRSARRRGRGCRATWPTRSRTWTPCAPTPRSAARPRSTGGGWATTAGSRC